MIFPNTPTPLSLDLLQIIVTKIGITIIGTFVKMMIMCFLNHKYIEDSRCPWRNSV